MPHARPHLTTHTRSKGHSAVAGVAYRLGLRLYDRRTGEWHDYRRRALGEEVVAALTLAPDGAPAWATDPAQVWAAVEAAEKRKDSQVAHDFRIPVPFGLTDTDAAEMARSMAQHIVDELGTVVSVGLHRDSPIDAMGIAKPSNKVGFHTHVYFPTRRLTFDASAVGVEESNGGESSGSDGWAFTDKLKVLSHKASAAAMIERLNQQWAELANKHAAAAGFVPDFTHLSYRRLGLDKGLQLTMGVAATAMERKGIATWKGDALRQHRNEAALNAPVVPASVVAHTSTTIATGTGTEVMALSISGPAPMSAPLPLADGVSPLEHSDFTWLRPADPIVVHRGASISASQPGTYANPPSLANQFLTALGERPTMPPPSPEQQARLTRWLDRVERVLRALARIAATLLDLGDRRQRDAEAWATFAVERDARRRERAEAEQAATQWRANHPLQVRLAAAMGGPSLKPSALVELDGVTVSLDVEVQWLKRHMTEAADRVAAVDRHITTVQAEQAVAQKRLEGTLQWIVDLDPLYGPLLLSISDAAHTPMLTQTMPVVTTGATDVDPLGIDQVLIEPVPSYRPEPSRGHRPSI
jgi:hypothetical protein